MSDDVVDTMEKVAAYLGAAVDKKIITTRNMPADFVAVLQRWGMPKHCTGFRIEAKDPDSALEITFSSLVEDCDPPITRAQFDAMPTEEQMAFLRDGGVIVDS